ncbi:MAG: hypothetical protein R3200_11845 [Xanthomonadales bacterium]|nr:hypothetical protein [Xanthomonadales bacterium]
MADRPSILLIYLAATPVFALVDWLFGWNLRVVGVPDPGWRAGYYTGLLLAAGVAWWRPAVEPLLVLIESACNIALIIIDFAVDSLIVSDLEAFQPPTVMQVGGFLIAGGFGTLAFNRALAQIARSSGK